MEESVAVAREAVPPRVDPAAVPKQEAPKASDGSSLPASPVVGAGPAKPAASPAPATPAQDVAVLAKKSALDALGQLAKAANDSLTATPASPGSPKVQAPGPSSVSALSNDQIAGGLKAALAQGLQNAISTLGRSGGFLTNPAVKIPMPDQLAVVDMSMRKIGQNTLADEFVITMNRAAEKAVPEAASVFAGSLRQMTLADARSILTGPTNSATEFFRRTAGAQLKERFRPIVSDATAKSGATAACKQLMGKASFVSPLLGGGTFDLDTYVTDKALDGLFVVVGEEEARIRLNPAARTTDLLKAVFGSVSR